MISPPTSPGVCGWRRKRSTAERRRSSCPAGWRCPAVSPTAADSRCGPEVRWPDEGSRGTVLAAWPTPPVGGRLPVSGAGARRYDVAVVGAGPVGSLCALAHARRGASVALLEANPNASKRLAGEWLHPPALRILRDFGIELETQPRSAEGKGFAVFPEDGSEPIVLRYPDGSPGLVCEHETLVSRLREAVAAEPGVDFVLHARVRAVEDNRVTYARNGADESLTAALIVGADGRASTVRRSLGLWTSPRNCSRMMGIALSGVRLPLEGFGHVVCGGPGPILIYRLGDDSVRVILDVPLGHSPRDLVALMSDSYAGWMPESLRPAFLEALRARRFLAAANALRPRATYGSPQRVLIGDAAGHYHPLTAVGMTLGFGDALTLAEGRGFRDFTNRRLRATRAPELLAMGLYEIFADHRV
ncbi:MAG: FAD-dependent oxidoreductase, partial [Acidimicrobiia bacterium]|nr:FAD-dependent oxidoreductase [Acidimicrobiia bacterium]